MTASAGVYVVYGDNILQCSTYLIAGPEGALLVDPGSGYWHAEVLDGIRQAGAEVTDISHVLLTHCHVDHARGAYRFGEFGIPLVASPRTAEILRAGGHQVWYEFPQHVVATEVALTPADGDVLDLAGLTVRVLHTPGHTRGCASYLIDTPQGLTAFTGDLLGDHGNPGWAGSEGFSVEQSIASIEKLLAAGPDRVCWGHGIVEPPACQWLREALERGKAGQWRLHKEYHPHIPPPPGRE